MSLHLDLFSGIGGFSIAAEACGFETVAFCEIDPEANIVTNHFWPHVPNLHDIRTITRDNYPYRLPDIIAGGVPCQPASALGLMRGTSDERWLWPDTIRIMRELRPRFGVFENPPALLTLEGGAAWNGIVSGLVASGYDLWWDVFPAAAFGAGHLRERVILVASRTDNASDAPGVGSRSQADTAHTKPNGRHARTELTGGSDSKVTSNPNGERRTEAGGGISPGAQEGDDIRRQSATNDCEASSSNPDDQGLQRHTELREGSEESRRVISGQEQRHAPPPDLRGRVTGPDWWHEAHTGIPVLATGLPGRVVEAVSRCIGNSVVPQAVMPIFEAIGETLFPAP